jgi:hypothetical protein
LPFILTVFVLYTRMKGFCFTETPIRFEKRLFVKGESVVAKQKRNLLDDLATRLRGLLQDLDRLMNPPPPAKPARVPVPVRPPQRPPRYDDPYR